MAEKVGFDPRTGISRFTRFRVGAVMTASILLQNYLNIVSRKKGEN